MVKYSLRQLKSLVEEGCAQDISMYDCNMREDLVSKHGPFNVLYSFNNVELELLRED